MFKREHQNKLLPKYVLNMVQRCITTQVTAFVYIFSESEWNKFAMYLLHNLCIR